MRMSEQAAKDATRSTVEVELLRRAAIWRAELAEWLDKFRADRDAILVHGPVYNGRSPERWYSDRMMLIGDAAHPYGPGGQGISMALKDASALSDAIASGFNEDVKASFQKSRLDEARKFGEAAEKRNSKASSSSKFALMAEGIAVKAAELLTCGRGTF
jgi:2-polyprenyl-6-methoxyphenol hydroxylase-like FAD-dependent oxidoreductase